MRRTRHTLGAALLALSVGLSASAGGRLPGQYMNEFHTGYPTPHIAWAKPYAHGRTRAFFIAPWTAAREVTELAQRLDLEVHGETTFSDKELGGTDRYTAMIDGTSPEDKLRRLRQKLAERYDVFVIANFPFNKLPTEIQYRIAKQVTEGAGLVLVYKRPCREEFFKHPDPEATKRIASGVPFGGLDFYRTTFLEHSGLSDVQGIAGKLVHAYRAKRGRVVQLDFGIQSGAKYGGFCLTPREPFTFRSATQYEYHQMLAGNAVLWAAGREPPVRVVAPPFRSVGQTLLPWAFKLMLEADDDVGRAEAEVTVRNAWGEVEHRARLPLGLVAGSNPVPYEVPALPGGGHYVDVRVRKRRQAIGWGCWWLSVEPEVAIAELTLDRLSFERTEPLLGTVRLDRPAPRGLSLGAWLLDNYGRVYAKTRVDVTPGATEVRFAAPLDAALSLAGRCRARLARGDQVLDQAEAEFFVPRRELDVFPTLLWGTFPGILGHFVNERLHSAGFNTILAPHYRIDSPEHGELRQIGALARDDMLCMPYTAHITRWRKLALGDEASYAKQRAGALAMVRHLKPFGPLVYSLGDENSILPEMGFQPRDRPGFLEHLRRTYGSIGFLNAAWGTRFARWEDAQPVPLAEGKQNPAGYHDTESYREALYARWHRWHHDLFSSEDPHARVGSEGSQPGDLEETIRGLEFWGPYRRTVDNTLLRSLAPRGLVRGNWFGGYNARRYDVPGLRRFLWDTFLDGSNLFEIYCCYTSETIFRSDLTFGSWTQAFLPDLQEIVDGIGQLAAGSEHEVDPVAVYHSQASVHVARVHAPFGSRDAIHEGALSAIEDAGYQPYYVTSRQVLAGALRRAKAPKVLVLGCAQAIGDDEWRELVDFVHAGGILIADVCPALFDGHASPGERGALDELFGVRRSAERVKPARGRLTMPATGLTLGERRVVLPALDIANVEADAAVVVRSGKALATDGGSPAVVVRGLGKGMAVLLNFPLSVYGRVDDEARHGLRGLLEGLIAFSGLEPLCRVTGRDGQLLLGCRAPRFRHGDVRTLMLLPRRTGGDDAIVRARLELAQPTYIYNQRTGDYLGRRSAAWLRLDPTSATVLSLLPYRVRRLQVEGDERIEAGQSARLALALETDAKAEPAGHVFRVKRVTPDGEEQWLGARTLRPAGSRATIRLPFAYNEPGRWTLRVRNVATGTEERLRIRVEETAAR